MLVLSRKLDEEIIIGTGPSAITITVVAVDLGGKVRIGIEAPKHVEILRREIWEKVHPNEPAPCGYQPPTF